MRDPITSIVIYPEDNPRLLRVSVTWWHPAGHNRGRPVKHVQEYVRPNRLAETLGRLLDLPPGSIR